ncbi:MAG: rRNA pseudouridine synthase [Spirochaetales bacterium]|nr:rRNA pseudouridine synthase [Spirochaetales bacterium]
MSGTAEDRDAPAKGERLQSRLAHAGVASRRACELVILSGRVRVNGATVTELGTRVLPEDLVELDGKPLGGPERIRRIALHKPAGHVCTMSDPEGRPTAVSLLAGRVSERVYNVGRLDAWSSGLILFTNDGELARVAGHPSGGIEKEYVVDTDLPLPEGFGEAFTRGIPEGGEILKAERVLVEGPKRARVVLVEGRNREIRRALSTFALRALSLVRVRIGKVELGSLGPGSWRDLEPFEVEDLIHPHTRS